VRQKGWKHCIVLVNREQETARTAQEWTTQCYPLAGEQEKNSVEKGNTNRTYAPTKRKEDGPLKGRED
jgi:hypothetical protein